MPGALAPQLVSVFPERGNSDTSIGAYQKIGAYSIRWDHTSVVRQRGGAVYEDYPMRPIYDLMAGLGLERGFARVAQRCRICRHLFLGIVAVICNVLIKWRRANSRALI